MIKKNLSIFLIMCLLLSTLVSVTTTINVLAATQATYYVAPGGNDSNPGTLSQPFATLQKARDVVRTINSNMTGDIIVYLRGGTYVLSQTLNLGTSDSGTNGYNIIYQAYPGETPIVSGGAPITGWSLYDAGKNIYRSNVGTADKRHLFVNGIRAVRARGDSSPSGFTLTSSGYTAPSSGFYSNMSSWGNKSNIEMVIQGHPFQINRCGISTISGSTITMKTPCWNNIQVKGSLLWVENAYELLDVQGEWYLNRTDGYIYYIPRAGENMSTAEIIAPTVETLVDVSGTSSTSRIHNIQFKGLTFSNTTWLQPNGNEGYACAQGGFPFVGTPAVIFVVPGGLQFRYAQDCLIERNKITHMGATGINIKPESQNIMIIGNVVYDTSNIGIITGDNIINSGNSLNTGITIKDNYVSNVGQEFFDGYGVVSCNSSTIIDHNEIFNTPYTSVALMSKGNSQITNNRVYNSLLVLSDGGQIYTNSCNISSNQTIANNYVFNMGHNYGAIYPDDQSKNVSVHDNVISNTPYWLFIWNSSIENITANNNYTDTSSYRNDGTNCTITNTTVVSNENWPSAAINIMNNAGIEAAYSDIRIYSDIKIPSPSVINVALQATATASSEFFNGYYPASKVKDGIFDGTGEWASNGELNPWIQLNWGTSQTINKITLYDRSNPTDWAPGGTLTFSDGSYVTVSSIPNNGAAKEVTFTNKNVTWVKFQVSGGSGSNVGLSEIQAFYVPVNIALQATATASSEFFNGYYPASKVKDGIFDGTGEWASNGELNPWIQLNWGTSQTINMITLYDRSNMTDRARGGTLTFSDGSSVTLSNVIPNNGSAYTFAFPSKTVTWVKFQASFGSGSNVGLSELGVYFGNVALGKTPTFSTTAQYIGYANDGQSNDSSLYTDIAASGVQWMQLDLGQAYNISKLKVWHYYYDGRTYHDVIFQLSNDPNFDTGVTTVFNNDSNNSAGKGTGYDAEYAETSAGKEVLFSNINARYVRFYANGSNINSFSHYVEVEVY